MQKKSANRSASKPQKVSARTTQMTPRAGHATRQMTPTYTRSTQPRFTGTRQHTGSRQYTGTRYYGGTRYAGTRYYGNTGYYGNPRYYSSGGGWGYPYYGYSAWPSGYSYGPSSYYSSYPYSYDAHNYSYYTGASAYDGSMVAAVQGRLAELGYYPGVVDGVMGPQTRAAIAAFESRHGLAVDGRISGPLLNRLGLA
jgi:hypothetical protein